MREPPSGYEEPGDRPIAVHKNPCIMKAKVGPNSLGHVFLEELWKVTNDADARFPVLGRSTPNVGG